MANDSVVLRFDEVTFEYQEHRPLLDEASFSVRSGKKIALMDAVALLIPGLVGLS